MSESNEIISKGDCELVLCKYLNRQKIEWMEYEIENNNLHGVSSNYYILKVNYKCENKEEQKRFFMKVTNEKSTTIAKFNMSINSFGKEDFFFNYLQNECLNEIIDVDFAPRGYLANLDKIVLEDLSVKGFKMRETKLSFDLKHCELALESLSKLHSAGISLEIKKGISLKEKFGDVLEEKLFTEKNSMGAKWIKCSVEGLLLLVEKVDLSKVKLVENSFNNFIKILSKLSYLTTILHGDLWNNNFLFNYEETSPQKAVIVDYQLMKLGPPGLDVLQLIFTNTRKNLRDNYYNHLIDTYYNSLTNNLLKNNIEIENILPRNKFLESLKVVEVGARIHAIALRTICFLDDETLKNSMLTEEAIAKFLYQDRSRCMLENFENNALFREVIKEDILDFINSLL